MSLWADPRGSNVRNALPAFANTLATRLFMPEAPNPTCHVLMRNYALGIISVALRVAPACMPPDKLQYVTPPLDHLPSPFPPASEIDNTKVAIAKGAIQMDFGNYTIGRLIPNRSNYDYDNATYQDIRRQIEHRIVELGYSPTLFGEVDNRIGSDSWQHESRSAVKTDRYGKKYSWIAYFEMYGVRLDMGALGEENAHERSAGPDIDLSFPEPAHTWMPSLPDLFSTAPADPHTWLTDGPRPNYQALLYREEVDGQRGPWVLLEGYVEQSAKDDGRRVFTFLRGVLVKQDRVAKLLSQFNLRKYPGNMAIPEPYDDPYTYAGEIPWSPHFGSFLRDPTGKAKRDQRAAFTFYDGTRRPRGIPVEVPVIGFTWGGNGSPLNQASGITILAPALCEHLRLLNRQGEWDLYDYRGNIATLYREFKTEHDSFPGNLMYLRADLMTDYLKQTGQTLVWLVWGERGFDHRTTMGMNTRFQGVYSEYKHIHRYGSSWGPQP